MRLAIVLLVVGVALAGVGATSPGPWIGSLVGVLLAVAGYMRLHAALDARREARRRARRPGYIVGDVPPGSYEVRVGRGRSTAIAEDGREHPLDGP